MSRMQERIENFERAFFIFAEAVKTYKKNPSDILIHMAVVQAFEVCFELSWKVLKDYLEYNGVKVYLPREVIKEAFAYEVIQNGQIWIDMLKSRNVTSHEYNIDKINSIIADIAGSYFDELCRFKKQTEEFHE